MDKKGWIGALLVAAMQTGGGPYLSRIEVPPRVGLHEEAWITVTGALPDPAWHLERPEIARNGHKVEVTLTAERKPGLMAAQVLVPFHTRIGLTDLPSGRIDLEVRGGHGQVLAAHFEVISGK